jgi:hypothetical protein
MFVNSFKSTGLSISKLLSNNLSTSIGCLFLDGIIKKEYIKALKLEKLEILLRNKK